ncbi:hypothetical protein [Propionibacterium freudenreichii]|uniref:hypothetical protein n=1 Tax=Propionibacterium freudenreichii TaxID=1744 RepID=UPI0012D9759F|nr:hypothetical protein [Propionibacterium freudenreichii]MDK9657447.1 hypothetical protein [Propionibacterium freudenreichii]MDK9672509.1 hypothetical protein [Propionibacterium freudenreichii]
MAGAVGGGRVDRRAGLRGVAREGRRGARRKLQPVGEQRVTEWGGVGEFAAASVPGQTTAPITTVPAQTPGAVAPGAAETPAATATQEGRMQAQWRESGFTICGQDLAVNGNTTCDFGTAVHDAYSQAVGGAYGSYGSAKTVEAKDAETGGTSTMSCTSGTGGIFCSGDNGVTVVFD